MLGVLVNRDLFQHYFLACFACSIALHPLYKLGEQSGIDPDLQDQWLYVVERSKALWLFYWVSCDYLYPNNAPCMK